LLVKIIVQIESKRIFRENKGKTPADLLIEVIEELNQKERNPKTYETSIEVNKNFI
jgi:hypothetical protein